MRRVTYYDTDKRQYVLLSKRQEDVIQKLGKLEDSLEQRDPQSFADYMVRLRQFHKVSQESFAAALHITPGAIKSIECGAHLPSYPTFGAIMNAYQVPMDELQFAFRRYAFRIKDEVLDYMIIQQNNRIIDPFIFQQIGRVINAERRFMSISIARLAGMIKSTPYLIRKAESGEGNITWAYLHVLAVALKSQRLEEISEMLRERTMQNGSHL